MPRKISHLNLPKTLPASPLHHQQLNLRTLRMLTGINSKTWRKVVSPILSGTLLTMQPLTSCMVTLQPCPCPCTCVEPAQFMPTLMDSILPCIIRKFSASDCLANPSFAQTVQLHHMPPSAIHLLLARSTAQSMLLLICIAIQNPCAIIWAAFTIKVMRSRV